MAKWDMHEQDDSSGTCKDHHYAFSEKREQSIILPLLAL